MKIKRKRPSLYEANWTMTDMPDFSGWESSITDYDMIDYPGMGADDDESQQDSGSRDPQRLIRFAACDPDVMGKLFVLMKLTSDYIEDVGGLNIDNVMGNPKTADMLYELGIKFASTYLASTYLAFGTNDPFTSLHAQEFHMQSLGQLSDILKKTGVESKFNYAALQDIFEHVENEMNHDMPGLIEAILLAIDNMRTAAPEIKAVISAMGLCIYVLFNYVKLMDMTSSGKRMVVKGFTGIDDAPKRNGRRNPIGFVKHENPEMTEDDLFNKLIAEAWAPRRVFRQDLYKQRCSSKWRRNCR